MRYVHYNETTGDIIGFYDDETHTTIPEPNITITEQEWFDFFNVDSRKRVDVNTQTFVSISSEEFIEVDKSTSLADIDGAAERARLRYITSGAGQALTYSEKADEAADYVAAGYPADTSNYPHIAAEIAATGKTKEQAADDILSTKSAWISVSANIEQHRLGGKKNVADATTSEEIISARDAAITALNAI